MHGRTLRGRSPGDEEVPEQSGGSRVKPALPDGVGMLPSRPRPFSSPARPVPTAWGLLRPRLAPPPRASALLLPIGCGSTEPTARDAYGNYATTSRYRSMNRIELTAALEAGLADADQRRAELESRAQTLGQDAIEELREALDEAYEEVFEEAT